MYPRSGGHCCFAGRLRAPPKKYLGIHSPAAWERGDVPWACWEALKLKARPLQVAPSQTHPPWGTWGAGVGGWGIPSPVPPASGRAAGLGAVFAGKRPRAELATPRIGCSVTTRKPGPRRSEPAAGGVPQPACLHPWGDAPRHPATPPGPRGRCGSTLGFIVLRRGATRALQGELFAASPWTRVDFCADLFSSFVDRCFWLGCSPQALFLSVGAGKGKCHPVLCMQGIINSAQLHLNLPVLTSLQS